jgi:hypothetical protein
LIPYYFSEIRLFYNRYLNILRGFCRVTALNKHYNFFCFTSTAYSATVCQFIRKCVLYKRIALPSLQWHLGNLCSSSGRCAMTVPVQGHFWLILCTWALKIEGNCKICQKYLCTVTVIATRPDGLQRFPRCHSKDKWQSYFFV